MGRFMDHTQEGSVLYVCSKLRRVVLFVQIYKEGLNISKLVTWPRLRPLMSRFMVRTQKETFYVSTKFEADCSIRSEVIRGYQNLEMRSHDPGHAHLGVVL